MNMRTSTRMVFLLAAVVGGLGGVEPLSAEIQILDLGTLGGNYSVASAINSRGQVVGYSYTPVGELHAFLSDQGRITYLGSLGGNYSVASTLNERWQMVGDIYTAGNYHAFLWEQGRMTDLGTLGGDY